VLSRIGLVELDDEVVYRAAALDPAALRTLDAIHLATALSLGRDLGAICAYDERLARAAVSESLQILAPS
jgi:predicted nucleic acid-binding protein